MTATLAPAQTAVLPGLAMVGLSITVILKVCGVPEQPFAIGITVTVAFPAAAALKLMLPLPLAARPMPALVFVQLNVAPVEPEKFTETAWPTQAETSAGSVSDGEGNTVIVKVRGWPLQPNKVGVTEMVAITGFRLMLTAEKLIFPEPLAGNPMLGFEFVQLNVAPLVPLKPTEMVKPAHTD